MGLEPSSVVLGLRYEVKDPRHSAIQTLTELKALCMVYFEFQITRYSGISFAFPNQHRFHKKIIKTVYPSSLLQEQVLYSLILQYRNKLVYFHIINCKILQRL